MLYNAQTITNVLTVEYGMRDFYNLFTGSLKRILLYYCLCGKNHL